MALTRSELLARAGLAAGAAALSGCARDGVAGTERPSLATWEGVRAQFALAPDLHHFAGFVLAPHPRRVRDAIEQHRRGLDENPSAYVHERQAELERGARSAAAAYLAGSPDQIALTDSTTMGLGLLYGGLRLRPGDEILTTEHDFYATHEAVRLAAARTGASVRRVRLYDRPEAASADEIVARMRRALRPRTRVVALTWVHSGTGVKLPVRAIAAAVAGRALVCVDGVHALGVEEAGVGRLGCDFLVAGCHKWLAGPRGTGIVWGRAWERTRATIPSFEAGGPAPTTALAMTPGGYHSFEHRWALAEAFALHREIGPKRVHARIHDLAGRLKDGLADLRHVRLRTPRADALSAGIVCLELAGLSPRDAVDRLFREHRVVATVTPYATQYVRLGPGLYTSEADVDAALEAVRRIGA